MLYLFAPAMAKLDYCRLTTLITAPKPATNQLESGRKLHGVARPGVGPNSLFRKVISCMMASCSGPEEFLSSRLGTPVAAGQRLSSRFIHTCFFKRPVTNSPTMDTIHGPFSNASATKTSSIPFDTPSWLQRGSATSGKTSLESCTRPPWVRAENPPFRGLARIIHKH